MKNITIFFLGALAAFAGCATALYYRQPAQPLAGSASDNTFLELPTSVVFAGPQASTLLVATNTARTYLEIENISTSTASQALFCSTNDRAGALNTGIMIPASSTKIFNLDNMYRGALRCMFQTATSAVSVIER